MSEENGLKKKLIEARKTIAKETFKKDGTGAKHSYMSLSQINSKIEKTLSENDVFLNFQLGEKEDEMILEFFDEKDSLNYTYAFPGLLTPQRATNDKGRPLMHPMQEIGSHISYARRYILLMYFNISTSEDLDNAQIQKNNPSLQTPTWELAMERTSKGISTSFLYTEKEKEEFKKAFEKIKNQKEWDNLKQEIKTGTAKRFRDKKEELVKRLEACTVEFDYKSQIAEDISTAKNSEELLEAEKLVIKEEEPQREEPIKIGKEMPQQEQTA